MAYLTKTKVEEIIRNAPAGTTPEGIVAALREQGHQLEGYAEVNRKSPNEVDPEERGLLEKVVYGLGNLTGVTALGKGVAAAINKNRNQGLQDKGNEQTEQIRTDLIGAIQKNRAAGKDTSRLETALAQLEETGRIFNADMRDLADLGVSNRDVIGSAVRTVGTIASFGTYGAGAQGAVTGARLRNVPGAAKITEATGMIRGAIEGAKAGAKVGAKGGSIFGALTGLGLGIEDEEKGVGGVLASAVGGAVTGGITGGIAGGAVGAVGGAIQARANLRAQLEQKLATSNAPYVERIKVAAKETADELKDSVDEVKAIKIENRRAELGRSRETPTFNTPEPTPGQPEVITVERAGTPSAETALFKRDPKTGKIVSDVDAKSLMRATGLEDGDIAMMKSGTTRDKLAYKEMLDVADELRDNPALAAQKKPTQVPGKNALKIIKSVKAKQNEAGQRINEVIRTQLAGKKVQTKPVYAEWVKNLADDGVVIDDRGKITQWGRFEDVTEAQNLILKAHKKALRLRGNTNAAQAHMFKGQLDELVDYGNNQGGVSGRASSIVKGLRKSIDAKLDTSFGSYRLANERYATAKSAYDRIAGLVGKKTMDGDDIVIERKLGGILQRIFSNNDTSGLDLTTTLDDAVAQLGIPVEDTITNQAYFARLLEDIYGAPKNSIAGRMAQANTQTVQKYQGLRRLANEPIGTAAETVLNTLDSNQIEKAEALRKYVEQLIKPR